MEVAIYLRKSRGQDEDLCKHREQLIALCKANGWSYDLYSEIGSSDSLEEREEMVKLLNNIKKYSKVIVMALDRLSRNELHQAVITQMLRENNVEVVTPTKTYNFNVENDILMSDFEKLIARSEFRLIKKRLVTGKIQSFKQGNWVQGFAPIPYEYNRDTKGLIINPEKLELWESIKELALRGYSSSYIGEKLGISALKVRRLLNNKTLLGYAKYRGEYVKGKHKPVITQEEWNTIQNYIKKRTNGTTRTKHKYPLTGVVKCTCGHSRTSVRRKDRDNKEIIAKCRYCKDSSMLTSDIHRTIIKEIKIYENSLLDVMKSKDNNQQLKKLQKELNEIEKEINKNFKKLAKVKEMILNDIIDLSEGSQMTRNIKNNIKSLDDRKTLVQADMYNLSKSKADVIKNLKMVYELLQNNIKDEEINNLYKLIIDKVVIKNKRVIEVVFK